MTEKSIHPDVFEARKIAALTHSGINRGRELAQEGAQ